MYEFMDAKQFELDKRYLRMARIWAENGIITMPLKYVKPYLYPLSSITEGQKIFLRQQKWCIAISTNGTVETTIEGFNWLNKNHFDYRGLIPIGLAVDATNLNIY